MSCPPTGAAAAHEYAAIFLAEAIPENEGRPSYGYIYGWLDGTKPGSVEWRTARTTKKDGTEVDLPLTRSQILRGLKKPDFQIGKRFRRFTNYLMLDIDAGSPYHPWNAKGLTPILHACEDLGLTAPLPVRSSSSQGLHLYFPLAKAVASWQAAKALHDALSAAGIEITGGKCELFPNPKASEDSYNAHRLPLQDPGSGVVDLGGEFASGDLAYFVTRWHGAAAENEFSFATAPPPARAAAPSRPVPRDNARTTPATPAPRIIVAGHRPQLPPIAWADSSESNIVMRRLANYGYEVLGLRSVPELGRWVTETAPRLQGYQEHASAKSKLDIERGWGYRWARTRVRRGGGSGAGGNIGHNFEVAQAALERLGVALKAKADQVWQSANKLFAEVQAFILDRFGVVLSKGTFQKHRAQWVNLLSATARARLGEGEEGLGSIEHESRDKCLGEEVQTVDQRKQCVQADSVRDTGLYTPPPDAPPDAPDRILITVAELRQVALPADQWLKALDGGPEAVHGISQAEVSPETWAALLESVGQGVAS